MMRLNAPQCISLPNANGGTKNKFKLPVQGVYRWWVMDFAVMSVWAGNAFALNTLPFHLGRAGRSNAMAHGVRGPLPDAASVPIWLPAECSLMRDEQNPRLPGVNHKLEVRNPLFYRLTAAIDAMLLRAGDDDAGLLFRWKVNGVCITMMNLPGAVVFGGRRELWTNPLMKLVDVPKQSLKQTSLWSNCQWGKKGMTTLCMRRILLKGMMLTLSMVSLACILSMQLMVQVLLIRPVTMMTMKMRMHYWPP